METENLQKFGDLLCEGNDKLQTRWKQEKRMPFIEQLRQALKLSENMPAPAASTIYKWEEGKHLPSDVRYIWRFAELFADAWGERQKDWDWFRQFLLTSGYATSETVEPLLERLLPDLPDNPYRGLAAFEMTHADWFFGRQQLINKMVEALKHNSFLAVIGPSGSGKSSVVQAGLIPALPENDVFEKDSWVYRIMKPGMYPLRALANTLASLWPSQKQRLNPSPQSRVTAIREQLAQGSDPFLDELTHALAHQTATRLLLVVDQFEELWTETALGDFDEQAQFLNLLLTGVAHRQQLTVIITMRADFLHRVMEHKRLAEAIQDCAKFVTPMDETDLQAAIVEPAKKAWGQFEPGLVQTLVRETLEREGALPLLGFTLQQLWEKRKQVDNQTVLTWKAFDELGRIEGAIAQKGDEVLAQWYKDPADEEPLKQILLRLVHATDDERFDIRRRVYLRELESAELDLPNLQRLLKPLVEARLLTATTKQRVEEYPASLANIDWATCVNSQTSSESQAFIETIELSHEALIRSWPTLQGWVRENRLHIRQREQLEMEARLWQANDQVDGFLMTGAKLAYNLEWSEQSKLELNDGTQAFLVASQQYDQTLEKQKRADYQEKLRLTERARRMLYGIVGALCLIVLVAISWAVSARYQQQALELTIAKQAIQIVKGDDLLRKDPPLGLAILIEAHQIAQSLGDSHLTEQALRDGLFNTGGIGFVKHTKAVRQVGMGADNRWLITVSQDQTAYLWDLETAIPGAAVSPPLAYSGLDGHIAWSDRWLATVSITNSLTLYDLHHPDPWRQKMMIETFTPDIKKVAISPDSRWLIVQSGDNQLRRWSLTDADLLEPPDIVGQGLAAQSFIISPDSQWLVVQTAPNAILGWSLTAPKLSPQASLELTRPTPLQALAVEATGEWLIARTDTHQLLRWPLSPTLAIEEPQMMFAAGPVLDFTLSPDGQWLVASDQRQGNLYRWDLTTAWPISETILTDAGTPYQNLTLSGNGKWLAATQTDNRILLWPIDEHGRLNEKQTLRGHQISQPINQLLISDDSRWLVSGSGDKTARIWPLTSQQPGRAAPFVIEAHRQLGQNSLLVNADNQLISLGLNRKQRWDMKLWDIDLVYPPRLQSHILADSEQLWCQPVTSRRSGSPWLAVSDHSRVYYWNLAQPQHPYHLPLRQPVGCAMAVNQYDQLITTTSDGLMERWDLATGQLLDSWAGHTAAIYKAVFQAMGQKLVTVSEDGWVKRWHFSSPTAPPTEATLFNLAGLTVIDIVTNNQAVWAALGKKEGTEERYIIYQQSNGNPKTMPIDKTAHSIQLSPHNRFLFIGAKGGKSYIWDFQTADWWMAGGNEAHENKVWGRFTADGLRLTQIGSWHAGEPKQWSLLHRAESDNLSLDPIIFPDMKVIDYYDNRTNLAISTDDAWAITGRINGLIYLWPHSINKLVEMACYTAGRNLTRDETLYYFGEELREPACEFAE